MVAAVEAILESNANGRLDPGAAAHTRLGGGTGFRGVEEVFPSRCAAPLNVNGANTYQFVMGDPAGRVDPWGTQVEGGGDGGDVDDGNGNGPPGPPPESLEQDLLDFGFGVQDQTGPPDYPLPTGDVWSCPPVIQAPWTPFDPSLWHAVPVDSGNPATPPIPNTDAKSNTLPPAEQAEDAQKAAGAGKEAKPQSCPGVRESPIPSPKFRTPTNAPQLPPGNIPAAWRVRQMPPTEQYPNGYWRLEKPMGNGGWQGIDPSAMKPGAEARTRVPLAPSGGQ